MTLPTVRINTFVQTKSKPFVDNLSKIYIIGGFLIGINRVPVLTGNYFLILPSLFYSWVCISGITYLTFYRSGLYILSVIVYLNVATYVFCILTNLFLHKRMSRYYNEINKFDTETGCRPKTDRLSIRCFVQVCVVTVYIITLFFVPYGILTLTMLLIHLIPVHVAISLELHYFGHAVSLLLPRLRLINYYMQISLTTSRDVKTISNKYVFFKNYNESLNCQMKKLMDLYYIAFQAYNYLIAAVKWQLLMIIISSFISVLAFCYHFSLNIIRGEQFVDNMISDLGLTMVSMVPLFAPCVSGSHIHCEVGRLRELIASRLYENKLDKSSRSIARALLEFTENRDLSFRLLRILDVDISLPFKFVGLLVTYLIILMQFEKVINPQN